MDKIERFQQAYDYLYSSGAFHSKTDLANKLGRSRENVSAAYHGRTPFFNDTFLRAFCSKFPEINQDWLLYGNGEMIEPDLVSEPIQMYQALPVWANTFIDILTEQVKQNEALNRQLHQSITEVSALKTELQHIIKQLKNKDKKP